MVRLDSQQEMWSRIRKGHRADIRHAEQIVRMPSVDNHDPQMRFREYQALHMLDAGRLTRPQETFDLMASWLPQFGTVRVLTVDQRDITELVAAAYFIEYERGIYYASSARHPDAPRGVAHLLLWSVMLGAAICGTHDWLDLGPVPSDDASDKELSIAHFKRGFGAEVRKWPY